MPDSERILAAVMFTDIVGYAAIGQRDETLSISLVEENRNLLRPIFARHNGKEIKTIGDAFLIEFPNALGAVRCAYDVQRASRELNFSLPKEKKTLLRVGIHLGDIVVTQGDIMGDAVNIASRIEPLAEQGGVCISRQVYDQVQNKFELHFASLGMKSLKNISTPLEIFKMVMPWGQQRIDSTGPAEKRRIAVMPFSNISSNVTDEYFAEGMTEELISTVSKVRELSVISRTSVMRYKNAQVPVSQIGQELKVGTVLEGSVRKAGNRVRIATQLIDVENDSHLWSETYDRDMDDIFAIQSEIAQRVVDSLKLELLPSESDDISKRPTQNLEAYDYYLKGRHYWNRRTLEVTREAIEFFEKAIRADPHYARAYLGLADCYLVLGDQGNLPSGEAFPKAIAFASKALELDDTLSEAHATLGSALDSEWNWKDAERELKRAIELKPGYAHAHHWYGYYLNIAGRHAEAMLEMRIAQGLDPLSPIITMNIGSTYLWERKYEEAADWHRRALSIEPNFPLALYYLGTIFASKSMFDEAIAEIRKAKTLSPAANYLDDVLAYSYAMSGRRKEALEVVDNLVERSKTEYVSPVTMAGAYVALDKEKAIGWLEAAFTVKAGELMRITENPILDSLHSDDRFAAILARMGLDVFGAHPM